MSKKLQDICIKYFEKVQGTEELWKCKCGKELKQRKGTGWSNLHTHIKVQHGLQEDGADKNQKTITHPSFGLINKQALNIYSWLDWICNDLKPFSFVESENTRKYTNPLYYKNGERGAEIQFTRIVSFCNRLRI